MTKDEALRLALEALEKLFGIPDKWTGEGEGDVAVWRLGGSYRAQQAITAIKAALEAKDEPVAWMMEGWGPDCGPYIEFYRDDEMGWRDRKEWTPLYTTPPQRTWVGLTEQEQGAIMEDLNAHGTRLYEFAAAIEAKLKEKNT